MENVNWDAAKFWLDVLQWVLTILVAVAMWIRTGRSDNRAAIDGAYSKIREQDQRLSALEEAQRHAPTHQDITALREEVAGMQSTLNTNTQMIQRVHDYLLINK